MNTESVFREFCKDVFGEEVAFCTEDVVTEFEAFYPSIVAIIQKDESFFAVDRIVFGRNLSALENKDSVWNHLPGCLFASFLHGDIRKKGEKIASILKDLWNASGQENDDISKILNDDA